MYHLPTVSASGNRSVHCEEDWDLCSCCLRRSALATLTTSTMTRAASVLSEASPTITSHVNPPMATLIPVKVRFQHSLDHLDLSKLFVRWTIEEIAVFANSCLASPRRCSSSSICPISKLMSAKQCRMRGPGSVGGLGPRLQAIFDNPPNTRSAPNH